MDQIRTVIIGYGGMGRQYAAMIYDGNVEGMRLSGICCRNRPGQEEIRALYPGIRIYPDVDDAFAHADEFDAAVIVTPHATHVEIGKKAFACRKHILSDKPAGISAEEVRGLLSAQPEGVAYGMMFNTRMEDAAQRAKELLDQGRLGRVTRAVWVCNSWFRSPAYHRSAAWRSSWSGERGGLLINQCQHYLDLWQWLLGMPDVVDADIDFGKYNDFLVDDSVDLRFIYKEGSAHPGLRGSFQSASGEHPGVNRLEIWGTKGRLELRDEKVLIFDQNTVDIDVFNKENMEVYAQPSHCAETLVQSAPGKQYQKVFQNFSDHIHRGTPLLADGKQGINSLILANAAYLSAWTGKKVPLPMDEGLYVALLADQIAREERGNY